MVGTAAAMAQLQAPVSVSYLWMARLDVADRTAVIPEGRPWSTAVIALIAFEVSGVTQVIILFANSRIF